VFVEEFFKMMPELIEGLANEDTVAIGKTLKHEKLITPEDLAHIEGVPHGQKYKQAAILTHALYRTIAVTPEAFSAISDSLSRHDKLKHLFWATEKPG